MTRNTKQKKLDKIDQEIKEIRWETRTPRTVFPLRGRECNVPLVCPKIFIIMNCILYLFSVEELKAKAPPAEPCMIGVVIFPKL